MLIDLNKTSDDNDDNVQVKCEYCTKLNSIDTNKLNRFIKQVKDLLLTNENDNSKLTTNIDEIKSMLMQTKKFFFDFDDDDDDYSRLYLENIYIIKLYELLVDLYIKCKNFNDELIIKISNYLINSYE